MKVLIMGLGLHGGGLESARYLLRRGAEITVTDLRDEKKLAPTIEQLEAARAGIPNAPPIRYVLGRHEIKDFTAAGMVIKNPGVRPDSPFLQAARRIETDISLFLAASPARLVAVTGSKGKSSVASAIYWTLQHKGGGSRLSGEAGQLGSFACGKTPPAYCPWSLQSKLRAVRQSRTAPLRGEFPPQRPRNCTPEEHGVLGRQYNRIPPHVP